VESKAGLHEFYKALLQLRTSDELSVREVSQPVLIPTHADQYVLAFMRRYGAKGIEYELSPNMFSPITDGYVHGIYTNIFTGAKLEIIPQLSFELNADYLVVEK
jgi:hypothetical protein